jgi:hypothetical protein
MVSQRYIDLRMEDNRVLPTDKGGLSIGDESRGKNSPFKSFYLDHPRQDTSGMLYLVTETARNLT